MRQGSTSKDFSRARRLVVVVVLIALTTACDWTTLGFDTAHTRGTSDPGPVMDHPAVVGHDWSDVVAPATVTSTPIVTSDRVFVTTSADELDAFSARVTPSTPNCEWQTRCAPLWSAASGASTGSSPTVADGVVFTTSGDGVVRAFDATGQRGCGGTPPRCTPLWRTAPVGALESSPLVLGGVLYVGSTDGNLYGYDSHGVTSCSAGVCTPTFSVALGSPIRSSPIAAGTHVIVGADDGTIASFDPATTGCPAGPCGPLWTATGDGPVRDAMVLHGDTLLVGSDTGWLRAYDATGATGCSGAPSVCTPRWSADTASPIHAALAVRDGIVIAATDDGSLHAYDIAGTACADTADCAPRWQTAPLGIAIHGAPVVADHRVFVGWADGRLGAFDLEGDAGCAGTPLVCTPFWTADVGRDSGPATISHSRLFVPAGDLHVFGTSVSIATDDIGTATLTTDGDDIYALNELSAFTVGIDAPTTNLSGGLRLEFSHPADPIVADESSCATWSGDSGHHDQEGAALRVHDVAGGTKAITITKNVWFDANWIFNVHVWDTSATPVATQIASFDLGSVLHPGGTYVPYPWSFCARVIGNVVDFVVWPTGTPQPSWGDPAYGGAVSLPPGYEDAGHAGWYVGHLQPGEHAGFQDTVANPIGPAAAAPSPARNQPRAPQHTPSLP